MEEYSKSLQEKDYCDESELFITEYDHVKAIELREQLSFIGKWVWEDRGNALVISGGPQAGKKTLLCSFLKESRKEHPGWLHLAHFASITPIYSNILYKLMVQLRNHFKIEQKVDLNEEKLRRYFKYWLEITSQFLQKQYLGYQRSEVPKVVIIIQAVDTCVDLKGNLVEHKFWLPSRIPSNIKLIITAKSHSQSIPHCVTLHQHMPQQRREQIMHKCCEKTQHLLGRYSPQPLYNLLLIERMVLAQPQFTVTGTNFQEVFRNYISFTADSALSEQEIKSLLYTLTLTRKGLKFKWVQKIINVSFQKWQLFCKYFGFFIVQTHGYFVICNPKARTLVQLLVDCHREKVRTYRNSIIRSLKNQALHLRGLEEMVFQLLLTENFSELKEVICRVQNFIMLYTPFSKELLCQCWVRLEQLQQFDPVFQYNKAIQAYSSHYYPKEEDLYKIIFQISIFFKEYAEFQNAKTSKFRHPLIKGEVAHLQEIGIYDELKILGIVGKCKIYKSKPAQLPSEHHFSKNKAKAPLTPNKKEMLKTVESEKSKEKSKSPTAKAQNKQSKKQESKNKITKQSRTSQNSQKPGSQEQASENERPYTSQASPPECTETLQTFNVEELNVGIVSNQQKFKQFFTEQMKEYLQNYFAPLKKNAFKERQLALESEESDNQEQSIKNKEEKQFRVDVQRLKDSLILKKYKEYLQQDYHKNGEEVSYYYYKQWIWLQFPWLCQTVKHIYSQMISECLPGSIYFMSPTKEFALICQVLRITKAAKETKMGIYTEKKIEILPIKNPHFRLEKLRKNQQKQSSICLSKRSRLEVEPSKKYKVNLSKIQDYLLLQKQQENKLLQRNNGFKGQLKGQTSLPSLSVFFTQSQPTQSTLLPLIKKSNFGTAHCHIKREKENKNQNSRDYTMVIRKFNELKHDNEILIERIEEIKRLQMQTVDKNQDEMEKITANINSLEEKHANLHRNLNNQQELSKKLEIILKICDLNKMYGSQTDYLCTYLDSLKQMIGIQEAKTKAVKQNIADILQKAKIHIKMLKEKKRELKSSKDQNSAFNTLATDLTSPQVLHLQFEQIQKELKQLNKSRKTKSKKAKLKESHYLNQKNYEELQESLGIKYGDANNQNKIQDFADKVQKLKMLKLKKADLLEEYSRLQRQFHLKKTEQNNILQSKEKGKIQLSALLVQKRKHLSQLKNRSQLLQNALQSLASSSQ